MTDSGQWCEMEPKNKIVGRGAGKTSFREDTDEVQERLSGRRRCREGGRHVYEERTR